jgi:uncharacterized membrane protein YuzA (DUF378 family)
MKGLPKISIILSLITAIIAGIVSVFQMDILGLAGTQWMILSILFAVWSLAVENCDCCKK